MRIIPVIDLKGGQVVHARGGRRDAYAPIESSLSRSSEPAAVVDGLLSLHPFADLYVADLDAIEGRGDHDRTLADLRQRFPRLRLWVDGGLCRAEDCGEWLAKGRGDLVIGSESQTDPQLLGRLLGEFGEHRIILSLDFRGDAFLGPRDLLDRSQAWPARVIVMTLARVGGGLGPDTERLQALKRRAPGRAFFAAGGVRGLDDLLRLAEIGAGGALIASSLHDGRLTGADLQRLDEDRT